MTIHEKYEYIDSDYLELRDLRHYIMDGELKELYNDEICGNLNDEKEKAYVSKPHNLLNKVYEYFIDGEYEEQMKENILDDMECNGVPESISDMVIECAMDCNEIVSADSYDEKYDECDELETEKEGVMEEIKNRDIKSLGYSMNTYVDMKDNISILFDKIDTLKIELNTFKSGYETLKECNEENDMIDMMEKIMNKTEEVAKTDIKRCEEINRLKRKSNEYLNLCERVQKKYIDNHNNDGYVRFDPEPNTNMIRHINLNRSWFENFWDEKFKKNILISNDFMSGLQFIIRYKFDAFLKQDTALMEDIISHLYSLNKKLEDNKDKEKNTDFTHFHDDKYHKECYEGLLKEDPDRHYFRKIDYEKELEKITDIHNY